MKIVAAVTDLFFTVKINEAAKRAGMTVLFVKTREDAMAAAREKPRLLLLDLNCDAVEPLDLIREVKADPDLKPVRIISYVSHVEVDLKKQAHDAGSDMVLARSAFSQSIVQILQRNAGIPVGAAPPGYGARSGTAYGRGKGADLHD